MLSENEIFAIGQEALCYHVEPSGLAQLLFLGQTGLIGLLLYLGWVPIAYMIGLVCLLSVLTAGYVHLLGKWPRPHHQHTVSGVDVFSALVIAPAYLLALRMLSWHLHIPFALSRPYGAFLPPARICRSYKLLQHAALAPPGMGIVVITSASIGGSAHARISFLQAQTRDVLRIAETARTRLFMYCQYSTAMVVADSQRQVLIDGDGSIIAIAHYR